MSTIATSAYPKSQLRSSTPSFLGIIRGELFKISRMWLTWIMLVLLLGATTLPYLLLAATPSRRETLVQTPLIFLYDQMNVSLAISRIFIGFFLIILTAYVIGQEFQFGTVRILLARGLGRVQLLLAKFCAILLVALALIIISILLHALLAYGVIAFLAGNLNALHSLTPTFWSNTWLYIVTVLISMGVTILMAAALSMLCRSLALGLSLSIAFFAVDNIGVLFLRLAYNLTHNQFWLNVTAYVLGPNINTMPEVLLPASTHPHSIGIPPLVPVDGPHTLWVALTYSLIFAVVALVLTWKRDVKE